MGKPTVTEPVKAPARPNYGKESNFKGKPGRSGPPKGSTNAIRHGLTSANLPKGCQYVYYRICSLRRTLEAAVLREFGAIDLAAAAAINTAIRQERNAQLAEHYARHNQGKLPDATLLDFYERAAKASSARDKAISSLRLDRDARDGVIDALYARLPAPNGNGKGTDEPA
jgi:hypothetical protein